MGTWEWPLLFFPVHWRREKLTPRWQNVMANPSKGTLKWSKGWHIIFSATASVYFKSTRIFDWHKLTVFLPLQLQYYFDKYLCDPIHYLFLIRMLFPYRPVRKGELQYLKALWNLWSVVSLCRAMIFFINVCKYLSSCSSTTTEN